MKLDGRTYTNKCFRVFASNRDSTPIYKCKLKNNDTQDKCDKVANTPQKCFMWNDDVTDVPVPEYLDREWYIQLAHERLRQFGGR